MALLRSGDGRSRDRNSGPASERKSPQPYRDSSRSRGGGGQTIGSRRRKSPSAHLGTHGGGSGGRAEAAGLSILGFMYCAWVGGLVFSNVAEIAFSSGCGYSLA